MRFQKNPQSAILFLIQKQQQTIYPIFVCHLVVALSKFIFVGFALVDFIYGFLKNADQNAGRTIVTYKYSICCPKKHRSFVGFFCTMDPLYLSQCLNLYICIINLPYIKFINNIYGKSNQHA